MAWIICECGKRGYTSRKSAVECRGSIKNRVRIYRCAVVKALLHLTNVEKQLSWPDLKRHTKKHRRCNDAKKRERGCSQPNGIAATMPESG